jgi:hypothetical protein
VIYQGKYIQEANSVADFFASLKGRKTRSYLMKKRENL